MREPIEIRVTLFDKLIHDIHLFLLVKGIEQGFDSRSWVKLLQLFNSFLNFSKITLLDIDAR